jgi:hypothetical protein
MEIITHKANGEITKENVNFTPSQAWQDKRKKLLNEINTFVDGVEKNHGKKVANRVKKKLGGTF